MLGRHVKLQKTTKYLVSYQQLAALTVVQKQLWSCAEFVPIMFVTAARRLLHYKIAFIVWSSISFSQEFESGDFVFMQDSVPSHRAKVNLGFWKVVPHFISDEEWAPHSTDVNPSDYSVDSTRHLTRTCIWGVMSTVCKLAWTLCMLPCSTTLLSILFNIWNVNLNSCTRINDERLLTENISYWFVSAKVFYHSTLKFGTFFMGHPV